MVALSRGCKPRRPLLLSHLKFSPDLWWIQIRQFVIFVKPTIIDMPLLSSFFDFCQTYKFLPNKSLFVQMPFFVILCEYLARDFLAYSPFLPKFLSFARNLPFSYNRHLSRFPSLSPHLRFCKTFERFLPISPFSPICHSRENRQLPIGLFCSHLNFLPDLWWILNCQICQFRKMSFS